MDYIEENRRLLAQAKAAEKIYQKKIAVPYDWKDSEDKREYIRDQGHKKFWERVKVFSPGCICSECGVLKIYRKEWVLGMNKVVCRMCYIRRYVKKNGRLIERHEEIITDGLFNILKFYAIDKEKLKSVLKEKDSNLKEFYEKSGYRNWDFNGLIPTVVHRDVMSMLGRADIFPCVVYKYEIIGEMLKERRTISTRKFAKLCNWSQSYQMKLERGMTVSQETRDKIVEIL